MIDEVKQHRQSTIVLILLARLFLLNIGSLFRKTKNELVELLAAKVSCRCQYVRYSSEIDDRGLAWLLIRLAG